LTIISAFKTSKQKVCLTVRQHEQFHTTSQKNTKWMSSKKFAKVFKPTLQMGSSKWSWFLRFWMTETKYNSDNDLLVAYLSRLNLHHIRVLLIEANSSGRQSISYQIDPKQLDLVGLGEIKWKILKAILFTEAKMKISFSAALNEETHCLPPSSYILPFSSDNTLIMKNQL
jgi:hypothetical protein